MVFKSKASVKNQSTQKAENAAEEEASVSLNMKKTGSRTPTRPKSPARAGGRPKSPARTKSPTRTESPARARGRPKSPARTKSPTRKSPSRTKKELSPTPLVSSTPKIASPKARSPLRRSPSRKSPPRLVKTTSKSVETYFSEKVLRPRRNYLDLDTDSDTAEAEIDGVVDKPQNALRGRTRRLEVKVEKMDIGDMKVVEPSTFNLLKRVARNSQNREVERIVHLKHFDNVAQKLGEFSDEDDIVQVRKSESIERTPNLKQIVEFGGSFGALFLTLIWPLSLLAFFISCNEKQCSFIRLPQFGKFISFSAYFNLTAALGFIGYATLLALLSIVPFGGQQVAGMATKQGKFTYIMNGLFSCLVLTAIVVGLETRKIPITDFIFEHLLQIAVTSYLFGLGLSIYAYIRSFYVPYSMLNIHVFGKSGIYGFFMGRELNPRLFGILDLKMYVFRLALIGSMLMNFTYLCKSLSWGPATGEGFDYKSLQINPSLIVLVLIQSMYYLDALAHESACVTSFEIQYEGFGYMAAAGYLVYPFMMTSITKYVVDYNVQLAVWKLILVNLFFILGLLLFRGSNNQKDAFRKNPYDPALSHLETIPTTKGKKLICSGFWGNVRHPNYLGDIMMNLAFAPFALCVPPVVSVVSIVLLLIHRSVRDHVRCKQKYGAAWDRYCSRVKYVLLPKVY